MADLMADHRRQLVLVFRHAEDAGVDADLAARQRERIGLLVHKQRRLPTYATVLLGKLGDQRIDHALHVAVLGTVTAEWLLALDFGKRLRTELVQLLLGDTADDLAAPGRRRGGRTGAEQCGNNNGGDERLHGSPPWFMGAVCGHKT